MGEEARCRDPHRRPGRRAALPVTTPADYSGNRKLFGDEIARPGPAIAATTRRPTVGSKSALRIKARCGVKPFIGIGWSARRRRDANNFRLLVTWPLSSYHAQRMQIGLYNRLLLGAFMLVLLAQTYDGA
jgi:hypothetical protein